MDDGPDTLRLCEACGGTPDDPSACLWCSGGYQDVEQQVRWSVFRRRMKKISGTYDFLRDTVEDLVRRLVSTPGSADLAAEGRMLLHEWEVTDPSGDGRRDVTKDLSDFVRRAVDRLTAG
jgi:hypothetical protein